MSADSQTYFESCALCRWSRGYLKLCRQFWQCRGKLHPSQSDGFDWVCPLLTQHDTLMRKHVRWLPNMSHRMHIVKAIISVPQTLEWGQMAPRTGVEATAGCPSSTPPLPIWVWPTQFLACLKFFSLILVPQIRRAYRGMRGAKRAFWLILF